MHDAAGPFCAGCALGLEPLGKTCRVCAEPGDFDDLGCPRCVAHPPPFSRAEVPFHHDGPLARVIHRFKYEDHPELARPLAQLLADFLRERYAAHAAETNGPGDAQRSAEIWRICAIPLHKSRYLHRLYDQAELLASELSKALQIPFLGALERVRSTQRQVGLTESEREANVKGAFRAVADAAGLNLLLVDDVLTTGSTARAAAEALRLAGAKDVVVVALARASSDPVG